MNISSKTALAALAVAFMGVCGEARASIIYDVNLSNGTEAVNGTITTDGNTGTLLPADITAWNLTASGVFSFVLTQSDAGVLRECPAECVEASSSSLSLAPADLLILGSGTTAFDQINFEPSGTVVAVTSAAGESFVFDPALSAVAESGTVSAVPEP